MKTKPKTKLTSTDKQKAILPGEVNPANAFTKMTVMASRSANKYNLKSFKVTSD